VINADFNFLFFLKLPKKLDKNMRARSAFIIHNSLFATEELMKFLHKVDKLKLILKWKGCMYPYWRERSLMFFIFGICKQIVFGFQIRSKKTSGIDRAPHDHPANPTGFSYVS